MPGSLEIAGDLDSSIAEDRGSADRGNEVTLEATRVG